MVKPQPSGTSDGFGAAAAQKIAVGRSGSRRCAETRPNGVIAIYSRVLSSGGPRPVESSRRVAMCLCEF